MDRDMPNDRTASLPAAYDCTSYDCTGAEWASHHMVSFEFNQIP